MSVDTPPRPGLADRRARAAVAALFFTNGALFANLIPRYPQIKADLGLSNAVYGLSVAAFPAGAIVAGAAAGVVVRRFGSARVATAGTLLTGAGRWSPGWPRRRGRSPPRCSWPGRWTRSPTWRRTPTGCGCSAGTGARSSTRSTRSGRSAR